MTVKVILSNILVFMCLVTIGEGYRCYFCSYGERSGPERSCITDPGRKGWQGVLRCNRTSFCVLQEQYDIKLDKVTSYFRSCSGNTWGNKCWKDYSHVTCRASCQGDLCNKDETGTRYQTYHSGNGNDGMYGVGARADASLRHLCCHVFPLIGIILFLWKHLT